MAASSITTASASCKGGNYDQDNSNAGNIGKGQEQQSSRQAILDSGGSHKLATSICRP